MVVEKNGEKYFWKINNLRVSRPAPGPRGSRVATLGAVVFSPERAMWIRAEGFGFRV
jgi:hypothetical protein